MIFLTLLLLLIGGVTPVAAQDQASQTPPDPPFALPSGLTPAEKLTRRHAPILYLKEQQHPCDAEGEPYVPAPVEVVFEDEFVELRRAPEGTVVERGITTRDLFWRDRSHYIDLPGRPRVGACSYELHFTQQMADHEAVVYARVIREPGRPGLALQYWFFYYFNDFNNRHEGDWEMIQLLFDDSNTATQALLRGPTRVTYAQHAGGETAGWEEAKLDKEGEQPVIYVAAGSHANFYGPGVWLGWGQEGAGLGCDVTEGPWDRVEPEVRLIPNKISGPADPFAWTTFRGRWGERERWVYNGPRGPNLSHSWREPFTWQDWMLAGAVQLQHPAALGPQPAGLFCELAEGGSLLFTLATPYPWAVGSGGAVVFALGALFVVVARSTLGATWACYWRHIRLFAGIAGILVPFSVVSNAFLYLLNRYRQLGEWLGFDNDSVIVSTGVSVTVAVQQVLLVLIVTPAVIYAVGMLHRGRQPTVRESLRAAVRCLLPVIGVHALATGVMLLFAVTIVGIPLAVLWAVRWLFAVQAVVLNGQSGRGALRLSAAAVRGNWWRTLVTTAVLLFIVTAFSPLVGLVVLVLGNVSQDLTNGLSSVLYALTFPFATIGATLLFLELTEERPVIVSEGADAQMPEVVPSVLTPEHVFAKP